MHELCNAIRKLQRRHAVLTAALAVAAWVAALYGAMRAPWVNDLYNLINHDGRQGRPESTLVYLFGFPMMLSAIFLLSWIAPDYWIRLGSKNYAVARVGFWFALIAEAVMVGVTFVRVAAVLALSH
jgi:hypothetical protein